MEAFDRSVLTTSIGDFNIGFPGQYWDEEKQSWYNYFRDYDATTERYLQSDPIGLNGGINTYVYVGGNPLTSIDPSGLDGEQAARWAKWQQFSYPNEYQFWDRHSESKGRLTELLSGRRAPKCNAFVWDALVYGGDAPPRMSGGNIPTTSDWYHGRVSGYSEVPLNNLRRGDIVVSQGKPYGHIGIFYPKHDGSNATISAGTSMSLNDMQPGNWSKFLKKNTILHNDWGFRGNENAKAYRCDCDM